MGGGVCIYLRHDIPCKRLVECESPNVESLWLHLRPHSLPRSISSIILRVVYHSTANGNPENEALCHHIRANLDALLIKQQDALVLVTGDLNPTSTGINLNDLTRPNSLKQLVNFNTKIDLFAFDISDMAWSSPSVVEFNLDKEHFGTGGFREAFKATSKTAGFCNQQWVVKRYLESAVDIIQQTKQTLEQHTKKVVEMHMLARNFTKKLEKELQLNDNLELYGKTLTYKKIYMGRIHGQSGDEWVTVEEYIDGEFTKYLNNTGIPCGVNSEIRQKCESLAHFSYERSHENIMVVDVQGSDHNLFDPEIASKELLDGEEVIFYWQFVPYGNLQFY